MGYRPVVPAYRRRYLAHSCGLRCALNVRLRKSLDLFSIEPIQELSGFWSKAIMPSASFRLTMENHLVKSATLPKRCRVEWSIYLIRRIAATFPCGACFMALGTAPMFEVRSRTVAESTAHKREPATVFCWLAFLCWNILERPLHADKQARIDYRSAAVFSKLPARSHPVTNREGSQQKP